MILIEYPPRPIPLNTTLYDLLLVDTHGSTSAAGLDLLALAPANWPLLQIGAMNVRGGSARTMESLRLAPLVPRDRMMDAGTTITLCPSIKAIRDSFFGGRCPYERCQHGIVMVSPASISDLGLAESSRNAHLTICPFCIGIGILREHESLVREVAAVMLLESATEELLRDSAIRIHRRNINDIRLEMGYTALPHDPGLFGLGVQPGGNGDDIEPASLLEYLDTVAHAEIGTPAIAAAIPTTEVSQPLITRASRRESGVVLDPRGRPRTRGGENVEYRRLDPDRRPGSSYTYAVTQLDSQRSEAMMRAHDYHNSLRDLLPQLWLQTGESVTSTPESMDEGDDAPDTHDAAMEAFDHTQPITHVARPGTPMPPPLLPERPRTFYRSAICSMSFEWYKSIQERVLNDICAICQQSYDGPLLITALPCGHFYHEECIRGEERQRTVVNCPYRCKGQVLLQNNGN